jgi:hypothetical protein
MQPRCSTCWAIDNLTKCSRDPKLPNEPTSFPSTKTSQAENLVDLHEYRPRMWKRPEIELAASLLITPRRKVACPPQEGTHPSRIVKSRRPPALSSCLGILAGRAFGCHLSDLGGLCTFRPPLRLLHYGPTTRNHPMDGFIDRLQRFSFHPPCHPLYELLTFTSVVLRTTSH